MRWQIFIDEYLIDFNGAQAAIRVGFSPGSARSQASEMLSRFGNDSDFRPAELVLGVRSQASLVRCNGVA